MKKILFLLLAGLTLYAAKFTTTNKCDQNITRAQLTICYNYKFKEADYVTYYATDTQVKRKMNRLSFKEDPLVPTQYRAYNEDYYKSNYDKFHLCEDAIMDFNKTALQATYYLSNAVPGNPYTNRYRWTKVEHQEIEFYENHNISYSITGVIHTQQGINKTIGKHKITVPEYFYKCFTSNGSEIKCYLMKNNQNTKNNSDVKSYEITLYKLNSILPYKIKFEK